MQCMQPCARCEQELPEAFFFSPDAMFCKRCTNDVTEIIRKKYNVIEAAYFRAQMRRTTRILQKKLTLIPRPGASAAAAGD